MLHNTCALKGLLRSFSRPTIATCIATLRNTRRAPLFSDADHAANIRNQGRMIQLAGGSPDRVIPGHDPLQFQKYPTKGRIATIK